MISIQLKSVMENKGEDMKKITVTHSNGTQSFTIVKDEIDFNNGGIYYKLPSGTNFFRGLDTTDTVTIEDYEPREWCIVFGLGSHRIYARQTEWHAEDYELMINQDLTKDEAMTMAQDARLALGMDEAE